MQKSTSSPHKSHWNRSFDLSKFHCPLHSSSTGRPTGPQQITNRLLHENDGYFWMTISNNFDFVSRLCIGLDGRKKMAAGRRVLDKFPSFFSAMPLSCYLSITFLSFFLSFILFLKKKIQWISVHFGIFKVDGKRKERTREKPPPPPLKESKRSFIWFHCIFTISLKIKFKKKNFFLIMTGRVKQELCCWSCELHGSCWIDWAGPLNQVDRLDLSHWEASHRCYGSNLMDVDMDHPRNRSNLNPSCEIWKRLQGRRAAPSTYRG